MEALRDLWTGAGLNAIEGWHYGLMLAAFIRHLVNRGLNGVRLIISDACRGLTESAADYLPQARWQRCMVHFYRNVFSHVPATKIREVMRQSRMLIQRHRVIALGRFPGPRCRVHRRSRAHKWPEATARALVEQPTLVSRLTPKAGWVVGWH